MVLFCISAAADTTLDPVVLGRGGAITGGIAVAATAQTALWNGLRFTPRALFEFCRYTVIFLREIIRSNLNVLRHVYAPRVDVRPGIAPTRITLKSPLGRFVLSSTVSLTLGTLVMDLKDETLTVHFLDQSSDDIAANTREVSGAFARTLARSLG